VFHSAEDLFNIPIYATLRINQITVVVDLIELKLVDLAEPTVVDLAGR
jgi:hypothetical protein